MLARDLPHSMKTISRVLLVAAFLSGGLSLLAQRGEGRRSGDYRTRDTLRAGDPAPDFKLKTMGGDREVQLSSFKGKRPVVLVFGSYT